MRFNAIFVIALLASAALANKTDTCMYDKVSRMSDEGQKLAFKLTRTKIVTDYTTSEQVIQGQPEVRTEYVDEIVKAAHWSTYTEVSEEWIQSHGGWAKGCGLWRKRCSTKKGLSICRKAFNACQSHQQGWAWAESSETVTVSTHVQETVQVVKKPIVITEVKEFTTTTVTTGKKVVDHVEVKEHRDVVIQRNDQVITTKVENVVVGDKIVVGCGKKVISTPVTQIVKTGEVVSISCNKIVTGETVKVVTKPEVIIRKDVPVIVKTGGEIKVVVHQKRDPVKVNTVVTPIVINNKKEEIKVTPKPTDRVITNVKINSTTNVVVCTGNKIVTKPVVDIKVGDKLVVKTETGIVTRPIDKVRITEDKKTVVVHTPTPIVHSKDTKITVTCTKIITPKTPVVIVNNTGVKIVDTKKVVITVPVKPIVVIKPAEVAPPALSSPAQPAQPIVVVPTPTKVVEEVKIVEKRESDEYPETEAPSTSTTTIETSDKSGNGTVCTAYEANNSKDYCLQRGANGECLKKREVYQTNKCLEWKNITKRVKVESHMEVNESQVNQEVQAQEAEVVRVEKKLQWCSKRKEMIRVQQAEKCGCQDIESRATVARLRFKNWRKSYNARVKLWRVKVKANFYKKQLNGIRGKFKMCQKKIAQLAKQRKYKLKMAAEKRAFEIKNRSEYARINKITNAAERKRVYTQFKAKVHSRNVIAKQKWNAKLSAPCGCKDVTTRHSRISAQFKAVSHRAVAVKSHFRAQISVRASSGRRGRRLCRRRSSPPPRCAPAPVRHCAPVHRPAPVRHCAPVHRPAPVRHCAPVHRPAPVRHCAPVHRPAPVRHHHCGGHRQVVHHRPAPVRHCGGHRHVVHHRPAPVRHCGGHRHVVHHRPAPVRHCGGHKISIRRPVKIVHAHCHGRKRVVCGGARVKIGITKRCGGIKVHRGPRPGMFKKKIGVKIGCGKRKFKLGCGKRKFKLGCGKRKFKLGCGKRKFKLGCGKRKFKLGCGKRKFKIGRGRGRKFKITIKPFKVRRHKFTRARSYYIKRGWTYCNPCAEKWQWTHQHSEEYYEQNGFTNVDGVFKSAEEVKAVEAVVSEPVEEIKPAEAPVFVTTVPEVYRDEVVDRVCVRREVKWNKSEKKFKCVSHSHKHAFKRCTRWAEKDGEMKCVHEQQFFGVDMCMNWTDVEGKNTCINNQVVYPEARCTKKVVFRGKKVCSCMKFYRPTEFCSKYSKRTGRCKSRKVFFGQRFQKIICKKTGKVVKANKKCGCLEKKVVFRRKYRGLKKSFKCTRCAAYKKKFGKRISFKVKGRGGLKFKGRGGLKFKGRGGLKFKGRGGLKFKGRGGLKIKVRKGGYFRGHPLKVSRPRGGCRGSIKVRVGARVRVGGCVRAKVVARRSVCVRPVARVCVRPAARVCVRPVARVSVQRTCRPGRRLCRVVTRGRAPDTVTYNKMVIRRRGPYRVTKRITKRRTVRSVRWYKSHGYRKISVRGRVRWVKKSSWRYTTSAEYQTRHITLPSVVKTVYSKELSSVEHYAQTLRVSINKFSAADQALINKCF